MLRPLVRRLLCGPSVRFHSAGHVAASLKSGEPSNSRTWITGIESLMRQSRKTHRHVVHAARGVGCLITGPRHLVAPHVKPHRPRPLGPSSASHLCTTAPAWVSSTWAERGEPADRAGPRSAHDTSLGAGGCGVGQAHHADDLPGRGRDARGADNRGDRGKDTGDRSASSPTSPTASRFIRGTRPAGHPPRPARR